MSNHPTNMKKHEQLLDILHKIGLSENESAVYLASLQLGPAKVAQLARASDVKRTTIYPVVETLRRRGLIREKIDGLKTLYVAENPDRLENILAERHKEFQSLFPEFQALYNLDGDQSIIKYYDTEEGLRNVYRELLSELRNGDDYYVIGDPERYDTSNESFFKDFIQKRVRINLNAKVLLTDSDLAKEYKKFERNFGEEVRILPSEVKLDVNVVITDKKVIIHQIIAPHITMVIENKSVVQMQKILFELLWSKS